MSYTAQDLITRAWFLSGIAARNLQTPTGDQITDGLQMLNNLLDFKSVETDLIPYFSYILFNSIPGQEQYFLPFIADIETSTFNIQTIRYSQVARTRTQYFGSSRADDIEALPFSFNYERGVGGGTYSLYFLPQDVYPIKLKAKLFLVDVQLTTDLQDVTLSFSNPYDIANYTQYTFIGNSIAGYDSSYCEYLRYALARYMCSEYGVIFNPQSEAIYQSMCRKLMYMSPPDLTLHKASILRKSDRGAMTFGQINLGRGWTSYS